MSGTDLFTEQDNFRRKIMSESEESIQIMWRFRINTYELTHIGLSHFKQHATNFCTR